MLVPEHTNTMTSSEKLREFLSSNNEGILLYDALAQEKGTAPQKGAAPNTLNGKSYLFVDPLKTIRCNASDDVVKCIRTINRFLTLGYYAAGQLSYEAGYALEEKFSAGPGRIKWPMLEFGIYRGVHEITDLDLDEMVLSTPEMDDFWVHDFKPSISKHEYARHFSKIKEYIHAGDVYQINFCFMLDFKMQGSLPALFSALTKRQKVSYAALIKKKDQCILSLSPEMFFDLEDKRISMKPMKGTLLKTGNAASDKRSLLGFRKSEKNHAENLMIVDLIRNDLSRFCKPDSVKVPKLFTIEEYETLYQMTSTITGTLKRNARLIEILKALFPSGSVTGAPKIRAMEIIHELESEPRGVYTGAIGFFGPQKKRMLFNIPIRTMVIDTVKGQGRMGIGSGVVIDSKASLEYKECLGKARFLTGLMHDYRLIETMLFEPNRGIFLLDEHIKRLHKSAYFFKIRLDAASLRKELERRCKERKKALNYRIRVLLDTAGNWSITFAPLKRLDHGKALIRLSSVRTNPANIFWYHKTTNRTLYDNEIKKAGKEGCLDTIFTNIRGELTEGCITNIFVKKNGVYYTPPVLCGLLPGIYRDHLLRQSPQKYKEKVLLLKDLETADEIMLCNSVRRAVKVHLRQK
jgi:para-aminobenzoate synthetase / 4-amino-4-deoxychorismate lyase